MIAMGLHDMAVTAAYTGGASLIVAIVGFVVLRKMVRRRLRFQLIGLGVLPVFSVIVGVAVAANEMFLSSHDLSVLVFLVFVGAVIAVAASISLAWAFERSAADVSSLAGTLADPGKSSMPRRTIVTGELHDLAQQLASVSAQLEASRQRERALDAARREVVAWVSHDLRSPIASVRAMAEALEDGVVDDEASVHRYHRAIRQESDRLGSLVDDLFELSRINAGAVNADQPFVPLAELITEVLGTVEPAASSKGLAVVSPINDLPDVLVPAPDLRRVIRNLLDNALRHTPVGGTVTVDASIVGDGEDIELSVADQCGGIPPDDLPRVFEVAFRGDVARSRDRAGGGLGLAIAKGLLEAHAGSIHVTNRVDGCRFVVRLPVMQRQPL
jgi:signal transduction histidine kinase